MIRRPPRSTLFPTRRSSDLFSNWYGGEDYDARRETPGWDRPGATRAGWEQATAMAAPGDPTALRGRVDRKGTRLSSSHQIISYALFRLQKKTRKTIT